MSAAADTCSVTEPERVHELRERVRRAEYVVDPAEVADALLRRGLGALALALEGRGSGAGARPVLNGGESRPPGARPPARSAERPPGRP